MGTRIRLNSLLNDAKSTLEPEARAERPAVTARAEDAPQQPQSDVLTATPDGQRATDIKQPPRRQASRRAPAAPAPERVHYSSLVRKEARLRDDQIESLTLRARKLSRHKTVTDQRITDNTLIRVAVDLLLAHEADLSGTSEAELRQSLGL